MASDLISRDAFKSYIDCGHLRSPTELCFSEMDVVRMIDKQPTVDAVEVVRCKDCVHAGAFPNNYATRRFEGGMNCYLCRGDDGYGIANVSVVYPDDYCSDGVRRVKEDAVD